VSFCAPLKFPSISPQRPASHTKRRAIHGESAFPTTCWVFLRRSSSLSHPHSHGAGGLSTWSEVNSEVHPPDSPLMEISPHSPSSPLITHTAYIQSHLRCDRVRNKTKIFRHERDARCYHVLKHVNRTHTLEWRAAWCVIYNCRQMRRRAHFLIKTSLARSWLRWTARNIKQTYK
jgi:hypothetical protein